MSTVQLPKWFKTVVALALVWNLMGIFNFYTQITLTEEAIAALPLVEQELMNTTPLWSQIAFAIGVFGGTLGCIGLFVQKKWSFYPLLFSLIAVMTQMEYWLFFTKAVEVYGNSNYYAYGGHSGGLFAVPLIKKRNRQRLFALVV